jgi:hypothetical protein
MLDTFKLRPVFGRDYSITMRAVSRDGGDGGEGVETRPGTCCEHALQKKELSMKLSGGMHAWSEAFWRIARTHARTHALPQQGSDARHKDWNPVS